MPRDDGPATLLGADILNLITTGMYDTPLAIYREYIQNAADAIEDSPWPNKGHVEISISPGERNVKIRDNGPGLTHAQARRELIPIARSRKERGTNRGFRGIGRLSGLAFADSVTFRTRASETQQVTEISWHGTTLRASAVGGAYPEQVIQTSVEVSRIDGAGWPTHFFEVEVEQVARHAAGRILNRDAVRRYVAEVGPVPMSEEFPFTKEVDALFADGQQPLALQVTLEGEEEPIRRRHAAGLKFSPDRIDAFTELQPLRVPAADNNKDAAIGWIAHSSYLGAIPKDLGIRGLRLRKGNIQIGGENVLDTLFREERFNRWCVGEIHVIDERLLPNGRRDYFEPSPHVRQIENHLESMIQGLVSRCRTASSARNRNRKIKTTLENMESAYELAGSGYLQAKDAREFVKRTLQDAQALEETLRLTDPNHKLNATKLACLKTKLQQFRPRQEQPYMEKIGSEEIGACQRIFKALADLSPSPRVAREMIEGILGLLENRVGR